MVHEKGVLQADLAFGEVADDLGTERADTTRRAGKGCPDFWILATCDC